LQYSAPRKHPASGTNSEAAALPCLNSNISIEGGTESDRGAGADAGGQALPPLARLSTQHRKSAFVLKESVQLIADKYGLENIGFLTLTFRDHITKPKEAQRRLNSLLSNVIKPRYRDYIGVMERQKSGRIHYHLLVALDVDIRTGFDFDGIAAHDYRSASSALRSEWSFWRKTAPLYGFGRTELLPIKSSTEAIAKYVGKYIAKHIEARKEEDKGARLVRYSNGARAGTTRFQFNSPGAKEWRRKLAIFAQLVQANNPDRSVTRLLGLTEILGPRWAYHHRDFILSLP
jgi:hypothetical protein